MAVRLHIKYKDQSLEYRSIAVATNDAFINYWKPIAVERGLEWVLLMHSAGIDFLGQVANLPDIIHEFKVFQELVSLGDHTIPPEVCADILERVTTIRNVLGELQAMPEKFSDAYIG